MQEQQPQSNDRDAWRRYVTLLERGTAADSPELAELAARLGGRPQTDRRWVADVRRNQRIIREAAGLNDQAEKLRLAIMQSSDRIAAAERDGGRHFHPQHPLHSLRQAHRGLVEQYEELDVRRRKAEHAAGSIGHLGRTFPELVAAALELES